MLRLRISIKKVGDALPLEIVDRFLEDRDKATIEFEYLKEKEDNNELQRKTLTRMPPLLGSHGKETKNQKNL